MENHGYILGAVEMECPIHSEPMITKDNFFDVIHTEALAIECRLYRWPDTIYLNGSSVELLKSLIDIDLNFDATTYDTEEQPKLYGMLIKVLPDLDERPKYLCVVNP